MRYYSLRPEVAESLFYLHQITGNPVYREWGWSMFQAVERHCKAAYGYAEYNDVTRCRPGVVHSSLFLLL